MDPLQLETLHPSVEGGRYTALVLWKSDDDNQSKHIEIMENGDF